MNLNEILDSLRRKPVPISQLEEKLYEIAVAELTTRQMRPGVAAKAYADAEGSKDKTSALYIKYRVEQLKAELREALQTREMQTDSSREEATPPPAPPPQKGQRPSLSADDLSRVITCSRCRKSCPRSKAIEIDGKLVCLECYL